MLSSELCFPASAGETGPVACGLTLFDARQMMESMVESIRAERIHPETLLTRDGQFAEKRLLPEEVAGVTIRYCVLRKGKRISLEAQSDKVRALMFLSGKGLLTIASHGYAIEEMAVAAAARNAPTTVESTSHTVEFLDIVSDLASGDEDELSRNGGKLPYFRTYSECDVYREEIKSAKTVSRTLIPPNLLPRFSMGSVQTTGPDVVHAHQHAMLEQFFFGLPGNNCSVRADAREISFGESVLLHIPRGSLHGVRVEENAALHYLWLDFFLHQEDMSYISETHIPIER